MKSTKRAERIHHKNRLKKKRNNDTHYSEDQSINKHVQTPAKCSCEMCGNPRKYNGNSESSLTRQERREYSKKF